MVKAAFLHWLIPPLMPWLDVCACVCVLGACVCLCLGAEALYVTCKLQNCSDANKGKPFPGYIDPNSLVVQDEYVFVQVGNCPFSLPR